MAKTLNVKGYSIYPYRGVSSNPKAKHQTYYINIRATNGTTPVDIGVYAKDRTRVKVAKEQWDSDNHQIKGGSDKTLADNWNARISELIVAIREFISLNSIITRDAIEAKIYGVDFLTSAKHQRLSHVSIPIYETVVEAEFKELYEQVKSNLVEFYRDGKEHIVKNETVVRKLTEAYLLNLLMDESIARDFAGDTITMDALRYVEEVYPEIKKVSLFKTLAVARQQYPVLEQQAKAFYQANRSHLKIDGKLFKYNIVDYVNLNKVDIKEFQKQQNELGLDANDEQSMVSFKIFKERNKQEGIAKQQAPIKPLTTEEIYKQGLYDKQNIFQLFALCYYLPHDVVSTTYHKIVIRLFEYREHRHPVEDVSQLNIKWFLDFFKFLKESKFYQINTTGFDPLNYDKSIFFRHVEKENEPKESARPAFFKPSHYNQLIDITRTVCNKFNELELLPKFDFKQFKKVRLEEPEHGTRTEHNLNKDEFDQLYWYPFDNKRLTEYQQIFRQQHNSDSLEISVDDLDRARNIFILQTMFGGQRGYQEYLTTEFLTHTKGTKIVSFFMGKVGRIVKNPLNDYTTKVLKKLDYDFVGGKKINYTVSRPNVRNGKAIASFNMNEDYYRKLLQTIGRIIGFDREVTVDEQNNVNMPIAMIFNPYFARKTMSYIFRTELKMSREHIEMFTGHKRKKGELEHSYLPVENTIENKLELIRNLKVGKNPYK